MPEPRRRSPWWDPPPGNEAREPCLRFTPLAWLKLQYLCHAGPTEVAGFGLSSIDDPLTLDDVLVVRQRTTAYGVAFDDAAVADLFDAWPTRGSPWFAMDGYGCTRIRGPRSRRA